MIYDFLLWKFSSAPPHLLYFLLKKVCLSAYLSTCLSPSFGSTLTAAVSAQEVLCSANRIHNIVDQAPLAITVKFLPAQLGLLKHDCLQRSPSLDGNV